MKKKFFIIPAFLIAISGGTALAQTDYLEVALNNPTISASEAKEIALKQVNGKIVEFDFDGDDRIPHYEIDIVKDNEKVEITIDAQTGQATISSREIINNSTSNSKSNQKQAQQSTKGIISQEQAIKIAQSKAAGTVTSVELDTENNFQVYEIEIRNGKTEYDFEIDATTGTILKYEEDLED